MNIHLATFPLDVLGEQGVALDLRVQANGGSALFVRAQHLRGCDNRRRLPL